MNKNLRAATRASLLFLALAMPSLAAAQSQFFAQVAGVPATITCAPDSVVANGGTFVLNWSVPTGELDATVEGRANGSLVFTSPVMIPGSSGTVPGDVNFSFAPVSFPYTFTVKLIPSIAIIAPTGISFFCPAAGPGTNYTILTFTAVELPAATPWGLVGTSLVLVVLGAIALRRRDLRSS